MLAKRSLSTRWRLPRRLAALDRTIAMPPHPKLQAFIRVPRFAAVAGAWVAGFALAASAAGCGGAAGASSERYPENRPEPARSASDGEVLGAHEQSPEDTLDASLTNLHPAARPPSAESSAAQSSAAQSPAAQSPAPPNPAAPSAPQVGTEEDCVEAGGRSAARLSNGPRRAKPTCPPNTPAAPVSQRK